jgi:carboxyl-terminal processing protease
MDEHTPKSRRVRKAPQRRISASMLVIGIILILGLGYVAGTYNNQIIAAIAPTFGLKVNKDTLDLSSLQDTYQALKANYDGDINDTKLVEAANKGMVSALGDDYTVYFNAAEAQSFNDDLSGSTCDDCPSTC